MRSASHAFSLGKTKVAMLAAAAFQRAAGGCDAGRALPAGSLAKAQAKSCHSIW